MVNSKSSTHFGCVVASFWVAGYSQVLLVALPIQVEHRVLITSGFGFFRMKSAVSFPSSDPAVWLRDSQLSFRALF